VAARVAEIEATGVAELVAGVGVSEGVIIASTVGITVEVGITAGNLGAADLLTK